MPGHPSAIEDGATRQRTGGRDDSDLVLAARQDLAAFEPLSPPLHRYRVYRYCLPPLEEPIHRRIRHQAAIFIEETLCNQ